MAVGVLQAAPEFTKEIYDQVTEKMFGHPAPMRDDESPHGLIVHSAGQGQQGYYVYDIWESQQAFERFMQETLGPAVAEVMGGPPPEGGGPQYFPIDVLVIPG
jgi:quinol monooxygenase YgiN